MKIANIKARVLLVSLTTLPCVLWAVPPVAIDDTFTTSEGEALESASLAANDFDLDGPADIFTLNSLPSNGTATVTPEGLLSYEPNIGFAGDEFFTYQIDDGNGGISTANIAIEVALNSDFLSSISPTVIGLEDSEIPLGLLADPALFSGGALQDIIATDTLFRSNTAGSTPVISSIPETTTGINITGYSTRNSNTNQSDSFNDDYQLINFRVDLRSGTYSGRLVHVVTTAINQLNQFSWADVPLGQSVLSDTSLITGVFTGASNPRVSLTDGQIHITETHTLESAYLLEYTSTENVSATFLQTDIAVQTPTETESTFLIPSELTPLNGPKGFVIMTANSAANGSNSNEEYKGFSRYIIDLESHLVSGVVAVENGETESRTVTWGFTDYPLLDLRDGPENLMSITSSTALIVGDTTGNAGIQSDPTIYINAAGELEIKRASSFAAGFTSIYTSENYQRQPFSSIATVVASNSDNTLFDTSPQSPVDSDGKPVNIQLFDIPASAAIGLVNMS